MKHRSNLAQGAPRGGHSSSTSSRVSIGNLSNRSMGKGGNGGGGNGNGDSFVTTVGYERPPSAGQKIGNSLQGLLVGPVVIFFGCLLLWYNEEWAVKTHRSLHEALDAHVVLDNAGRAAPEHRGRLVHLTHMVSVEGRPVEDPLFEVTRPNSVSLQRQVEIYQWVQEIKKKKIKRGDHTEIQEIVNYKKKWVPHPIDSDEFRHPDGHENCCGSLPMNSELFQADQVKLGLYTMSYALTQQMSRSHNVPSREVKKLPQGAQSSGSAIYLPRGGEQVQQQQALPPSGEEGIEERRTRMDGEEKVLYIVKATGDSYSTKEKALEAAKTDALAHAIEEKVTRMDGQEKTAFVVKSTGDIYSTREKALAAAAKEGVLAPSRSKSGRQMTMREEDEIGDVRITFSEVPCSVVSVLAQMSESGDGLVPWRSKQGSGYDVAQLSYGVKTAADMIEGAQQSNKVKTWTFRFFGWFLNFVGFSMITSIVSTAADITLNWIPLLGPMATSIINLGVNVANFILANCTTMIVASIAWVVYRPLLGISLLAGSVGLFFTASQAGRGKASPAGSTAKAQ